MKNNMKLYLFPPRSKNEFLNINIKKLESLDFIVQKTDMSFVGELLKLKRDSIVVLNWAEDRVYGHSYKRFIFAFLKMFSMILFSKLFAKKVVWVRHNFAPHDGSTRHYRYKSLCALYSLLNIKPIALEPYYSTPSLVHPLYKSDAQIKLDIESAKKINCPPDNMVVFFGAVKRYKNLHQMLDSWPKNVPLKIAGYCDDPAYQKLLENKISENQLNVDWLNKFLSLDELNTTLQNAKFVLLPHASNTMISSGSFYHAIGEGCNVITNTSEFGNFKRQQHKFVSLYDPSILTAAYLNDIYVDRASVMQEALSYYGESNVVDAWRTLLLEQNENDI